MSNKNKYCETSGAMIRQWYMIDGADTYYKVVGFPNRESMWVKCLTGDEFAGTGELANVPVCSHLKMGTVVRYGNGTRELKPEFLGVV